MNYARRDVCELNSICVAVKQEVKTVQSQRTKADIYLKKRKKENGFFFLTR